MNILSLRRLAILFAMVVVLPACVERTEQLTINPDGRVEYRVSHESNVFEELLGPDAFPSEAQGWIVQQQRAPDFKGRNRMRYSATAQTWFAAGAKLPANFAAVDDPDADLYLQFPTTLAIEQRPDGTYYHFRRVYEPRAWAQIELLQNLLVQEPMRDFMETDPKDWTRDERYVAVRALASFEAEKYLTMARTAYLEVTPDAPQDAWLLVRDDVRRLVEELNYPALTKLLEPRASGDEEDARGQSLQVEARKFQEALHARVKSALKSLAGYGGAKLARFQALFDRQLKTFDITESLGSHTFNITVTMPGQIIAHNADRADVHSASWTFQGPWVRDRRLELMATSRVTD